MSGHWRFCVAAFLLSAGLSATPAFSNPFTDLFNPAPKEAAAPDPAPAPAPAREQCLSQPGGSTAPGQHWVYRLEGHRKCWYQADAATVAMKRQARRHAIRQPVIASEDSEAALRKKPVADARAQLVSAAPAEALQPTPPAPEPVDTASVAANGAATLVPAAPTVVQPSTDEPAPVDVEMLLAAAAPTARDKAAPSAPPAVAVAASVPEEGRWEARVTQAGKLLIALGLVFLIGSLLASRLLDSRVAPVPRA